MAGYTPHTACTLTPIAVQYNRHGSRHDAAAVKLLGKGRARADGGALALLSADPARLGDRPVATHARHATASP